MENERLRSVTIVNRYYSPHKSVIAEAANDLAIYLMSKGVDVKIVSTNASYNGGGGGIGITQGECHVVNAIYDGNNKILRFLGNFIEGYRLIKKTIAVNKGTIIVMTNPALLNYWASQLLNARKISWFYWSMDLFPEAFRASNLVSNNNFIYKYLLRKTYAKPPNALIALGDIQATYLSEKFRKTLPTAILPCGVFLKNQLKNLEADIIPNWKKDVDKIYLGYIGNLGEAHSPEFIKWTIDHMDPETQRLILVVYGAKAPEIKSYLKPEHNSYVQLLDFVPRGELRHIDLHLVSLSKEWVNVCVPSKMVSAAHQGSLVLFFGSEHCDSWQDHQDCAWLIKQDENAEEELKRFLKQINQTKLEYKKSESVRLPSVLNDKIKLAYDEVYKMLT